VTVEDDVGADADVAATSTGELDGDAAASTASGVLPMADGTEGGVGEDQHQHAEGEQEASRKRTELESAQELDSKLAPQLDSTPAGVDEEEEDGW